MSENPADSSTPTPPDGTPLPRIRCIHLCCKAMMVYGEAFESDPDYQAGITDFWCQRTQKACGPDNGDVSLEICSEPGRGCYQAY